MKSNLKKPGMKTLVSQIVQEAHLSECKSTGYYLSKKQLQELLIYINLLKQHVREKNQKELPIAGIDNSFGGSENG